MDIAASIQNVTEKIVVKILDSLIDEYKIKNSSNPVLQLRFCTDCEACG